MADKISKILKQPIKEKVTELQQVFRIIDDKPYYELKYKKVGEDYYHIGYSSYDFNNVLQWEKECFELVNCIECKYEQENIVGRKCQACIDKNMFEKR